MKSTKNLWILLTVALIVTLHRWLGIAERRAEDGA